MVGSQGQRSRAPCRVLRNFGSAVGEQGLLAGLGAHCYPPTSGEAAAVSTVTLTVPKEGRQPGAGWIQILPSQQDRKTTPFIDSWETTVVRYTVCTPLSSGCSRWLATYLGRAFQVTKVTPQPDMELPGSYFHSIEIVLSPSQTAYCYPVIDRSHHRFLGYSLHSPVSVAGAGILRCFSAPLAPSPSTHLKHHGR